MQVDLRCPSLRECDLGLGTASKLKQIHVSSKSLSAICWQGFPDLADIHIACPGLTSVCNPSVLLDQVFPKPSVVIRLYVMQL